jgi:hypothetical protein
MVSEQKGCPGQKSTHKKGPNFGAQETNFELKTGD